MVDFAAMPAKKSSPLTVSEYLRGIDPARRGILERVRDAVNDKLPAGYVEGVVYGMIAWYVPIERFPGTYNGQPLCCAALGVQKNYNSLHLMAAYGNPKQAAFLRDEFARRGKKLDMGKACLRFKSLDDLPLDVIGSVIASMPPQMLIDAHELAHQGKRSRKKATRQ
jgi:hypothetical protein